MTDRQCAYRNSPGPLTKEHLWPAIFGLYPLKCLTEVARCLRASELVDLGTLLNASSEPLQELFSLKRIGGAFEISCAFFGAH